MAPSDTAIRDLLTHVAELLQFLGLEKTVEALESERASRRAELLSSISNAKLPTQQCRERMRSEMLRKFDEGRRDECLAVWQQYVPAQLLGYDEGTRKLEFMLHIYFAIYPALPMSASVLLPAAAATTSGSPGHSRGHSHSQSRGHSPAAAAGSSPAGAANAAAGASSGRSSPAPGVAAGSLPGGSSSGVSAAESARQELAARMRVFKAYVETRGAALAQTEEFLPFYALPFVPNPEHHPSFAHLFTDGSGAGSGGALSGGTGGSGWVSDVRLSLKQFLDSLPPRPELPKLFEMYEAHLAATDSEPRASPRATLQRRNSSRGFAAAAGLGATSSPATAGSASAGPGPLASPYRSLSRQGSREGTPERATRTLSASPSPAALTAAAVVSSRTASPARAGASPARRLPSADIGQHSGIPAAPATLHPHEPDAPQPPLLGRSGSSRSRRPSLLGRDGSGSTGGSGIGSGIPLDPAGRAGAVNGGASGSPGADQAAASGQGEEEGSASPDAKLVTAAAARGGSGRSSSRSRGRIPGPPLPPKTSSSASRDPSPARPLAAAAAILPAAPEAGQERRNRRRSSSSGPVASTAADAAGSGQAGNDSYSDDDDHEATQPRLSSPGAGPNGVKANGDASGRVGGGSSSTGKASSKQKAPELDAAATAAASAASSSLGLSFLSLAEGEQVEQEQATGPASGKQQTELQKPDAEEEDAANGAAAEPSAAGAEEEAAVATAYGDPFDGAGQNGGVSLEDAQQPDSSQQQQGHQPPPQQQQQQEEEDEQQQQQQQQEQEQQQEREPPLRVSSALLEVGKVLRDSAASAAVLHTASLPPVPLSYRKVVDQLALAIGQPAQEEHAGQQAASEAARLLQALRWRLLAAEPGEGRWQLLTSWIAADLMGCHRPYAVTAAVTAAQAGSQAAAAQHNGSDASEPLLEGEPASAAAAPASSLLQALAAHPQALQPHSSLRLLAEEAARITNAIASDRMGRAYLLQPSGATVEALVLLLQREAGSGSTAAGAAADRRSSTSGAPRPGSARQAATAAGAGAEGAAGSPAEGNGFHALPSASRHDSLMQDSPLLQQALVALQKLSLKRAATAAAIKSGALEWVVGYLESHLDAMSEFTAEYGCALMMNLILRDAGRARLERVSAVAAAGAAATGGGGALLSDRLLAVCESLLDSRNEQIRSYVHGTLYAVFNSPLMREAARARGLRELLEATAEVCQPGNVFSSQIRHIIGRLEKDDLPLPQQLQQLWQRMLAGAPAALATAADADPAALSAVQVAALVAVCDASDGDKAGDDGDAYYDDDDGFADVEAAPESNEHEPGALQGEALLASAYYLSPEQIQAEQATAATGGGPVDSTSAEPPIASSEPPSPFTTPFYFHSSAPRAPADARASASYMPYGDAASPGPYEPPVGTSMQRLDHHSSQYRPYDTYDQGHDHSSLALSPNGQPSNGQHGAVRDSVMMASFVSTAAVVNEVPAYVPPGSFSFAPHRRGAGDAAAIMLQPSVRRSQLQPADVPLARPITPSHAAKSVQDIRASVTKGLPKKNSNNKHPYDVWRVPPEGHRLQQPGSSKARTSRPSAHTGQGAGRAGSSSILEAAARPSAAEQQRARAEQRRKGASGKP